MIHALAIQLVGDANFQFLKAVQHVQLGQRYAVHAGGGAGLAYQHSVKPAATAFAPGVGAKFMAAFAQPLAIFIVQFRRERAFTDPRGVGFDDAEHEINAAGADARAGGGLAGDDVGRGDIRVGAKVDIQERALGTLKQNALAGFTFFVEDFPDRGGVRQDGRGDFSQAGEQRCTIDGFQAKPRRKAS